MKRLVCLVAIVATIAIFASHGGQRIVGFRTATTYDNRPADFPRTVVARERKRLTLDDGSRFVVGGYDEEAIAAELAESEQRVRIEDGVLFTARRIGFCSFDFPQRLNLLTIPIVRTQMRRYGERMLADVRPLAPPATTRANQ